MNIVVMYFPRYLCCKGFIALLTVVFLLYLTACCENNSAHSYDLQHADLVKMDLALGFTEY